MINFFVIDGAKPKPTALQRGPSVYQALRDEMMKQKSAQPPSIESLPKPPPPREKTHATMMDVIMMGSVISRPTVKKSEKVQLNRDKLWLRLRKEIGSTGHSHCQSTEGGDVDDSKRRSIGAFGGKEEASRRIGSERRAGWHFQSNICQ